MTAKFQKLAGYRYTDKVLEFQSQGWLKLS